MTAIYIHPCYLSNIIFAELLTDNEIYDLLLEIYHFQSTFKIGYLVTYALAALERDIVRSAGFEQLDLKKVIVTHSAQSNHHFMETVVDNSDCFLLISS